MSRVLITQIGLVAIVEHAPAVMDAYIRDNHQLSGAGTKQSAKGEWKKYYACAAGDIPVFSKK
jgi:hypothetical protein